MGAPGQSVDGVGPASKAGLRIPSQLRLHVPAELLHDLQLLLLLLFQLLGMEFASILFSFRLGSADEGQIEEIGHFGFELALGAVALSDHTGAFLLAGPVHALPGGDLPVVELAEWGGQYESKWFMMVSI